MKIDFEFVELHTPLFLNGVNFGTKLYADRRKNSKGPVDLWYDTVLAKYFVLSSNKLAMLDTVASSTLVNSMQVGVETAPLVRAKDDGVNYEQPKQQPVKAQATGPERTIRTAQVSTPMDVVQGVPSKGKKPRYQGEESQGE